MMKRAQMFAFAFILFGCSTGVDPTDDLQIDNPYDGIWQDSPEVPFWFVLEQSFGAKEEPEEALLAWIYSATSDGDGNVYILDNGQSRIVSFSRDGAFRWTAGRAGQGPGEFANPGRMLWNGADELIVSNNAGTRFEIYDTTGQFIESKSSEAFGLMRASIDGFLDSTTMVLSTGESGRVGVDVHVISIKNDWEVISTFGVDQMTDLDLPVRITASPPVTTVGGKIVVGYVDRYQFDIYQPTGEVSRVVTRAVDGIVRPVAFGNGIRRYSAVYAPLEVSNAYRLIFASWPESFPNPEEIESSGSDEALRDITYLSSIDLYDDNWQLLYAWTVERGGHGEIGRLLHADGNGRVYAEIKGDYPRLGRYRLEVTSPD